MTLTAMTPQRARICLVAPEFVGPFPNGGVGTACYWEAVTLARSGFDVTVVYTGSTDRETPDHWERTYNAGAFTYVDLWKWAANGHADVVARVEHPCAEARTSELVFRFLKTRRFDLLLFQEFLGHGARTLQARRSGEALSDVPAAVTLHSCRQWIYEGMQRTQASADDMSVDFLERESARLADFVLAPSRHMADWAVAHWPAVQAASVVPYCYDSAVELDARRVAHAGPFEHLVFFGRLETRKGLHLLCRALASSPDARGSIRRVTFLGKRSTVEGRPSAEFIVDELGGVPNLEIDIIDSLGSFEALAWIGRQRRALVVAPSLVDNLPYAVIELFTRQIPFISSRTGGIPEIVGAANAHLLAETTVASLAGVLARVHAQGELVIDYRDGYAAARASDVHVAHVRQMLRWRPSLASETEGECDVVIVDAEPASLAAATHTLRGSDPTARGVRVLTWDGWRAASDRSRPAIFLSQNVVPTPGMVRRLLSALADPRVDAATSYYGTRTPAGHREVAPLGASLEAGWVRNVAGGPCLVVRPSAFDDITRVSPGGFRFWPAFSALACAGRDVAMIPAVLYDTGRGEVASAADADAVAREYARGAGRLDLGWMLKHARTGAPQDAASGEASSGSRGLYDHLLAIPARELMAYCGWSSKGDEDCAGDLRGLRRRLGEIVAAWQRTTPRVFVYGAGEHARVMLALEPELGRFVSGFIDRRPVSEFLGRPCIRPEDVTASEVDTILYSSREFERDMYARLSMLPVEHVLLYAPTPPQGEPTTAMRLRRRLGHHEAPVDGLRAMYQPPAWATGFISGGDTEFLLELVTGTRPDSVLELGVASGASSAALLFALDHLPAPSVPRHLLSCDVRPTCYFDATRPTGSAVAEMYPHHQTSWTLETAADARRLLRVLSPQSFDLLFIDANHSHPWTLLDVLHLAPIARPDAWVALHDIDLPNLNPKYQVHGPQWLYEAWPFNKVRGVGASRNIGAVQLPADLRSLVPMAVALLDRSWEHAPSSWDVDLPELFRDVSAVLESRLVQPASSVAR